MNIEAESGLRQRLLRRVPDTPIWVEARGTLLDGACDLFGDESGCVVRSRVEPLLSVVGRVGREELCEATAGLVGEWALVCASDEGDRVAEVLGSWSRESAHVHSLPRERELPAATEAHLERVEEPSPALLDHLPRQLRDEIARAAGSRPMVAAWVDGRAVSFCYASFPTETLWDVAVDTLAEYRRQGLAAACASELIRAQRAIGLEPVWAALASIRASLALAARLGFERVGRMECFEAVLDGR